MDVLIPVVRCWEQKPQRAYAVYSNRTKAFSVTTWVPGPRRSECHFPVRMFVWVSHALRDSASRSWTGQCAVRSNTLTLQGYDPREALVFELAFLFGANTDGTELTLETSTRGGTHSNLGRDTGYPYWGFSCYLRFLGHMSDHSHFLTDLFKLIIHHFVIRGCLAWATAHVVNYLITRNKW